MIKFPITKEEADKFLEEMCENVKKEGIKHPYSDIPKRILDRIFGQTIPTEVSKLQQLIYNKMTKLEQKLNDECLQARKDKDSVKANLLLTIKGQVQNAQKNPDTASDIDAVINAAAKSIIKGLETVTQTEDTDREKVIASEFLPVMLSRESFKQELIFMAIDYNTPMGQLMPRIISKFNGTIDNKMVAPLIQELKKDTQSGMTEDEIMELFRGEDSVWTTLELQYKDVRSCIESLINHLEGKANPATIGLVFSKMGGGNPEESPLLVTDEDKKVFTEAILNPPPANEKLKMAQIRHKETIVGNDAMMEFPSDPLDGDEESI